MSDPYVDPPPAAGSAPRIEGADPPPPGSPLGMVSALSAGTLSDRMGIQLLEAAPERVVARMPVRGNTQPYGLLHGGASAVLAETAGSIAAMLHAGEGRYAVGLDLNATHHRGVRDGHVTATATALSLGSTVASYEVVVADDTGARVCTARLSCLLRDQP